MGPNYLAGFGTNVQKSTVFWNVYATSIGNVLRNETRIFSNTAVKTSNLGYDYRLKQYELTEMVEVQVQ